MDRFISRQSFSRAALAISLTLLTAGAVGCKSALSTAAYLYHGTDVPAAYDDLNGRRVAVVVRPTGGPGSPDAENGARELAQKIGGHLSRNVRGIKVIDHQDVDRWRDERNEADRDDPRALGAALKADRVVAVELEEFRLNDNSTSLYTGRCDYRILVYDLNEDATSDVAWEFSPNEAMVYPPNHGIPIGNKTRAQFRKIFVSALSERIAKNFYPHDKTADFARDSDSLEYH
jgi:hypothetical protein